MSLTFSKALTVNKCRHQALILYWIEIRSSLWLCSKLFIRPSRARVLVLCEWDEIGYLKYKFAEELISKDLPTFYHKAMNIHLPELLQASRWRLAGAEAPAFACKRILLRSHFTNRARSKAFGRSMLRRSFFEIRKKRPKRLFHVGIPMQKAQEISLLFSHL